MIRKFETTYSDRQWHWDEDAQKGWWFFVNDAWKEASGFKLKHALISVASGYWKEIPQYPPEMSVSEGL